MKHAFWKDFFREIRHSFGRFASILSIVLLGVAFFAGVSASPNNMRATADRYFDDNRMQDLRLISTIGFDEHDVAAVRETEGVRGVDAVYTLDALGRVNDEDNETVFSVMSVPTDLTADNEDYMNRFRLYDGRLPEAPDEMVIRVTSSKNQPIRVGDRVTLKSGTDDPLSDTLNTDVFTVVGIVWTPYSISFDLGSSQIGNGSVSFLAWIPETAFESEYYTGLFVTLDGTAEADCFSDDYFSRVEPYETVFKDLSLRRIPERTDDIKAEIYRRVEEEVTEKVTDSVTEEVEKAVREEIEKAVLSEVETAVSDGIADTVLTEVENAVRTGIEDAVLSEVENAVRTGIESAVRAEVENAVRAGIESNTLAAVTAAVEAELSENVMAEVRERATEEIHAAAYNEVTAQVKASIEASVRPEVETQVKAALSESVRAEIEAQVVSQIEAETYASVSAAAEEQIRMNTDAEVRAGIELMAASDPNYPLMSEEEKAAYIAAAYDAAFPSAFENAKAAYLGASIESAYPAALETALAQYKDSLIEAYYPAAYQAAEAAYLAVNVEAAMPEAIAAAESQYLDAYVTAALPEACQSADALYLESAVEAAYPGALEAARAEYLESAVAAAYPGALETAMQANFQTLVNQNYPAALNTAMAGNYQRTVDEQYAAALETALAENLQKTVDEEYPAALETAMAENFQKTVDEEYPKALETAMAENFQKTVDETVPEEVEKILPDKIDEIYEEQVEEQLNDTDSWKWYVLNRHAQPSFVEYEGAADQMTQIAAIFPIFFFFVAALVCFTTMTRMVDEQRSMIGTLKAIGYGKSIITLRYVLYAGLAAGIGGVIGAVLGMLIFPLVVFNAWGIAYQLPAMIHADNFRLCVISVVSMVFIVTVAAFLACFTDLHASPAILMRPKSPKLGKKILLERITPLWKHFSFSMKVTARNIFRYKRRFIMTLAGVAGCTALLVTGFGVSDSVENLVTTQFDEIFRYDAVVTLKDNLSDRRYQTITDLLASETRFDNSGFFRQETASANAAADKDGDVSDETVTLVSADSADDLAAFYLLRDPSSKEEYRLSGDGVFISNKLSKDLGLETGDTIYVENGEGVRNAVRIDAVIEMYISHYIFMTSDTYAALFGEEPYLNTCLASTALTQEGEDDLGKAYMERNEVTNVSFFSLSVKTVRQMISALSMITIVLIISSALLSFVVLYNLANVNISERLREIATIKVLGFYDPEVNIYVYRESLTITVLGALAGLPLGILVHHMIMGTIDVQAITFGNYIDPLSYLYSFLLTVGFSFIVSLFVNRKLKKIPMVESLKSVE